MEDALVRIAVHDGGNAFYGLAEIVPQGVLVCDVAGTITYSNAEYRRLRGCDDEELVGEPLWNVLSSEDDRTRMREYIRQMGRRVVLCLALVEFGVVDRPLGTHARLTGVMIAVQFLEPDRRPPPAIFGNAHLRPLRCVTSFWDTLLPVMSRILPARQTRLQSSTSSLVDRARSFIRCRSETVFPGDSSPISELLIDLSRSGQPHG